LKQGTYALFMELKVSCVSADDGHTGPSRMTVSVMRNELFML